MGTIQTCVASIMNRSGLSKRIEGHLYSHSDKYRYIITCSQAIFSLQFIYPLFFGQNIP